MKNIHRHRNIKLSKKFTNFSELKKTVENI